MQKRWDAPLQRRAHHLRRECAQEEPRGEHSLRGRGGRDDGAGRQRRVQLQLAHVFGGVVRDAALRGRQAMPDSDSVLRGKGRK